MPTFHDPLGEEPGAWVLSSLLTVDSGTVTNPWRREEAIVKAMTAAIRLRSKAAKSESDHHRFSALSSQRSLGIEGNDPFFAAILIFFPLEEVTCDAACRTALDRLDGSYERELSFLASGR